MEKINVIGITGGVYTASEVEFELNELHAKHYEALAAKDAEIRHALQTIEALVAAGFVTKEKVDQARALFTEDQPAPHPDTARLDKLPTWQPIDSAPIDRYIAAWCPARRMSFQVIYRYTPREGWTVIGDRSPFCEEFSHWQPMPEFDEAHQEPKP